MANETREFLDALYQEAAKEDESPEETAKRVSKNLRGVSRRELLGGAGAVGLGGLIGGGGVAATGTASADASTSDSDGNVGTPGDPADFFADGLNIYDGANNQIGSLDETGLDIPSVRTETASINSAPASYHLITDGSTIDAISMADDVDTLSGYSSIGVLFEEIIKNQLPPTGTDEEAAGAVYLSRGHYPGKLSDYSTERGVVGAQGLKIIGETRNDPPSATAVGKSNVSEPNVVIETDDVAFIAPSTGDINISFEAKNLGILGPGEGPNGSCALLNPTEHTGWDWVMFDNLSIWHFDTAHDFRGAHLITLNHCHFEQFRVAWGIKQGAARLHAKNTEWVSPVNGSGLMAHDSDNTDGSGIQGASFEQCRFLMSPDDGSGAQRGANLYAAHGEDFRVMNCVFELVSGSPTGANRGLTVGEGLQSYAIIGNVFRPAGSYTDHTIRDYYSATNGRMIGNADLTNSPASLNLNNSNEPIISANYFPNGVTMDSPTRPRINGTVYLSGSPSASNYDSGDAGTTLIDKSTSPSEVYKVTDSGVVDGPLNSGSGSTGFNFGRGEVVTRSFDTSYQNTTGSDIALMIAIRNETGGPATLETPLYVSPNDTQEFVRDVYDFIWEEEVPDGQRRYGQLIVPSGDYYYIENGSNNQGTLHNVVRRTMR